MKTGVKVFLYLVMFFVVIACSAASPDESDFDSLEEVDREIEHEADAAVGEETLDTEREPADETEESPQDDDAALPDEIGDGEEDDVFSDEAGSDADEMPDDDAPILCDYKCPFDIEPRRTVLGLPASGEVDATLALWAVLDDGSALYPQYLTSEASWSSLDPGVVTVDAAGVLTPVTPGKTFVRADYQGYHAYAEVIVAGTLYAGSITHDLRKRTYLLYVPEVYDGVIPLPLVVGLHGGSGTALGHMQMSQLNRAAHDHGFFAVYPDGATLIQTWNGGNCCGKAVENGIDDVGFIRKLIETLVGDYAIDHKRVYTSGFSNGAIMSHRLACEAADLFAAVAPLSGGINLGGDFTVCAPSRPVPIIMFHGTTDENYPIEGGVGDGLSGVDFYPVVHPTKPDTLSDWLAMNNAAEPGTVTYQKGDATCTTYDGDAPVVMCIVDPQSPLSDGEKVYDGGGHAYPGGMRNHVYKKADVPSKDIDANEAMWEFFSAHTLP